MIYKNFITVVMLVTGLSLAPLVSAQDEAPAPEQETKTGSQETEYNEDNYRRFMELKDQPSQTSTLPTNAYQSGTEKLDELPEESQKHLRNQLREIILEGDEWAPGDEDGKYPFVASEAGEKDPGLKQQEAEAWGELVGKYHEREAQIYANAARSEAATATEGGAPDAAQANAGESGGQQGSGESGKGENQNQMGQKQSGQQGQSAENQTASNANERSDSQSSSSASAGDPNAVSTSGVSESALEYLLSGNSKSGNSKESGGSPGTQDASSAQQAKTQQQAEAAESAQAESESLSQQQSAEQQNQQQQATQQNPSEFVVISKGTLSIKELQNAQGITVSTGSNTPDGTEEDRRRKEDDG